MFYVYHILQYFVPHVFVHSKNYLSTIQISIQIQVKPQFFKWYFLNEIFPICFVLLLQQIAN